MNSQVRAVARDLREHPERWTAGMCGGAFTIDHTTADLAVWVANSAYGVDIRTKRGAVLWGGVTMLSTFGLSPSHWMLWFAVRHWRNSGQGKGSIINRLEQAA